MYADPQLVKFPINDSFWSNFEPVEISQKINFLPTDHDSRKFLKASRIHCGKNHSNAIFEKFLTTKTVSIKYHFSCREQLIYAMNMLYYSRSIFKKSEWTYSVPISKLNQV